MGIEEKKSSPVSVTAVQILIIIFFLLHQRICRAAVWSPVGGNSSASAGGREWLVGDVAAAAAEEEFFTDSEINRRMLDVAPHFSVKATQKRPPAVSCGQKQGSPRTGCLPERGKGPGPSRNINCGTFNRGCSHFP